MRTPRYIGTFVACLILSASTTFADPIHPLPDPPARPKNPSVGPGNLTPSWDLDGLYLWLGPTGAASHVAQEWDTTFGADATVIRVREQRSLAFVGGTAGASLWTVRGGGRIWVDALAGTRIRGTAVGLSLGPIVELARTEHARFGGSVGVWTFFGIAPFARLGAVQELGAFVEIGLHISLPVLHN